MFPDWLRSGFDCLPDGACYHGNTLRCVDQISLDGVCCC